MNERESMPDLVGGQGTPPERPNPGLANRTRVMAAVNVPMRLLLGLPFRTPLSRVLMLISFRGRRTGKQYRQPVSYVPYDGDLLTPGGGRWKLNLRADEPVSANVNGKRVLLRPEFVRDIDEVGRLVGHMLTLNPRAAGFMPFVQEGAVDRDRLEAALSYGFAIVRWHLLELGPRWKSTSSAMARMAGGSTNALSLPTGGRSAGSLPAVTTLKRSH